MTKFGYDSLNFAKMFTLPVNAKRENFVFFDSIWLQSSLKWLKLPKLPICDIFASLLCLGHVFFAIFKDRVFPSFFSTSTMFTWFSAITNSISIGHFTPLCKYLTLKPKKIRFVSEETKQKDGELLFSFRFDVKVYLDSPLF